MRKPARGVFFAAIFRDSFARVQFRRCPKTSWPIATGRSVVKRTATFDHPKGLKSRRPKKASDQSNLTKGRIAAAHGRFSRIRQVVPTCTPCNTRFLGRIRIHNPNGISIASAVFAGLTAVTDRPTDGQTNRPTDHAIYSVCNNRPHLRT